MDGELGTIVVVDDERDILEVVSDALREEGFSVVCMDNPCYVVRVAERRKPSVFFLDIVLPDINGIALAAQLRDGGFRDTPMIAMSSSPIMLRAARESNLFQATLSKPFDLSGFLDCVEHFAQPAEAVSA